MAVYYSKEKVQEIVSEYGRNDKDTGNTEAQVALLTFRIQKLSEHLQENRKDHSCRKALLTLVGRRKKMLRYLQKRDIVLYRDLIEKLSIRK